MHRTAVVWTCIGGVRIVPDGGGVLKCLGVTLLAHLGFGVDADTFVIVPSTTRSVKHVPCDSLEEIRVGAFTRELSGDHEVDLLWGSWPVLV